MKYVIGTMQAKLAQTKETTAHLSAQLEATQKQMAEMYQIMQSLRQASGVQVQLPLPASVRLFTPVSIKFNAFMPFMPFGLSAFVPLCFSAFVPFGLSVFVPL
jgi:hypothetical protein